VGRKRGQLRDRNIVGTLTTPPETLSIPIYTCRQISGQLGPDGPRPFPWQAFNVVRHGKLIYRGGHLTMSAMVNRVFIVAGILICLSR